MKRKTLLLIFPLMAFLAFTTRVRAQPATPENVYAAPGNAQAAVRFDVPASSDPASTFNVTINDTTTNSSTTLTDFTASPILVPNLINGNSYTFQVTAVDSASVSGTPSIASNSVVPNTGLYSSLAGNWNLSNFFAGPIAPYSQSCHEIIDENGGVTGGCKDTAGNTVTLLESADFVFPSPYGMIPIVSAYSVTEPGGNVVDYNTDPFSDVVCQFSFDNTFGACTATASMAGSSAGSFVLATMSKEAAAPYSQTGDLPGFWSYGFLDIWSGGADINQGIAQIYGSGAFVVQGGGGILALSSSGELTCIAGICSQNTNTFDANMDAGLTTMAGISTSTSGDATLMLFLKEGSRYSVADLAGVWENNKLDTSGFWDRAIMTIDSNGVYQTIDYDSNGGTGSGSGKLAISPTGVVICEAGDCGNTALLMDASKTIMAETVVKSHSGGADTYRMMIATKTASPPAPPTGVSATAANALASVGFTPPASTGGSPIVSYTVTSSPGSVVATGTASPITVTGLTNGKPYTFTVSATNAAGFTSVASAKSNRVKPSGPIPPKAPTGVHATAGNGQATVSFRLPAGAGTPLTCTATSYPGNITATGVGSPITVTGLTNGTTYKFRVTVTNSIGTSPASGPSNVVTPATLPDAPTAVSATAGNRMAVVSFTAPDSNGSKITTYMVTSSPDAKHPNGVTAKGSKSPITVKGLINGTSYTFTVTAKNQIGTGPASAPSSPVTPRILVK